MKDKLVDSINVDDEGDEVSTASRWDEGEVISFKQLYDVLENMYMQLWQPVP